MNRWAEQSLATRNSFIKLLNEGRYTILNFSLTYFVLFFCGLWQEGFSFFLCLWQLLHLSSFLLCQSPLLPNEAMWKCENVGLGEKNWEKISPLSILSFLRHHKLSSSNGQHNCCKIKPWYEKVVMGGELKKNTSFCFPSSSPTGEAAGLVIRRLAIHYDVSLTKIH